jgi:hypothetical protein
MLKNNEIALLERLLQDIKNNTPIHLIKQNDVKDLSNLVARCKEAKQERSNISNNYNKQHQLRHRYTNNLYNARKRGDAAAVAKYEALMQALNSK